MASRALAEQDEAGSTYFDTRRLDPVSPRFYANWLPAGEHVVQYFARVAHAGFLDLDDPDLAARQFLALINADLQLTFMLGGTPTEAEVQQAATNAVRTFLRAYGKRQPAARQQALVGA